MASSPVVVDYMQLTLTLSLPPEQYFRGMVNLSVYGYCWFSTNGYAEEVQYLNFLQQMVFPKNRRFDTFSWQCKPGVSLAYKPIYGNLDVLSPQVQGQAINLLGGVAAGLVTYMPDGTPGTVPVFTPA